MYLTLSRICVFLIAWASLIGCAYAAGPVSAPDLVLQSGHTANVNRIAFSPNNQYLASGSSDHTIRVWDIASGRTYLVLTGDLGEIKAVTFSPDGRILASGSADQTIKLWDATNGRELRTIDAGTRLDCLYFTPDGSALGNCSRKSKRWDVATGRELHVPENGSTAASEFGLNPDVLFFSFDEKGVLVVVDEATGSRRATVLREKQNGVEYPNRDIIGTNEHARLIAVANSTDGSASVLDPASGATVFHIPAPAAEANGMRFVMRKVVFSPDDRWLAALDADAVRLFDAHTGQLLRSIAKGILGDDVRFSPDSRLLAEVAGGQAPEDRDFRVWAIPSGEELHRLMGVSSQVVSVSRTPDDHALVTANSEGRMALWDLKQGRLVRGFVYRDEDQEQKKIFAVALSADGHSLAALTEDQSAPLVVFDTASGKVIQKMGDGDDDIDTRETGLVQFFPDRSHIIACNGNTVTVWSTVTKKKMGKFEGVHFATGTHLLAVAQQEGTVLLDPLTGRVSRKVKAAGRVMTLSADEHWLAVGSDDGIISVWDVQTGRQVKTLTGHTAGITALAFSRNDQLFSGSADNTIKIWDFHAGSELKTLEGHTDQVTALAFSSDGHWLISASADASVRFWDASSGALQATLVSLRAADDWVTVAPLGSFDGSELGTQQLVAWRLGGQLYSPDRFYADYYMPGLLGRILAREQFARTANLASISLPPAVRILSPLSGTTTAGNVVVKVDAKDQGGGVGEVRLYQNGKLVTRQGGARGFSTPYAFKVELVPGENVLRAIGVATDQSESNPDTVRLVYQGQSQAGPALYVVVVGLNQYEDQALNLQYARPDAESVAAFFEKHVQSLFSKVRVVRLLDADATRDKIQAALSELTTAKREDVLIVYFAGHGISVGEQFYFLPYETRVDQDVDASAARYGISATSIGNALVAIPALKQLLVLDACQSQTALPLLAKAIMYRSPFAETKAKRMLARSNGLYLVSASLKEQYAIEVPALHHGVLTYALLSGLGENGDPKAEVNNEGFVTVEALLKYVKDEVPELTTKYSGGRQEAISLGYGMDFPLVVK